MVAFFGLKKCVVKCIWETNREEKNAEEKKVSEEASEENESREKVVDKFYDSKMKTLNFKFLKPTDFKGNKRVIITEANDDLEEIRRNNLKNELVKVVEKYKNEHCDKSGNVINNNMSETQLKDMKELKSRIRNEGLNCGETDKTGKLTLDTLENIKNKICAEYKA